MPTNRKRIVRGKLKTNIPRGIWFELIDSPLPKDDPDFNPFFRFVASVQWKKYKKEVLKYWTKNHPGTRPLRWWHLGHIPVPKTEKAKLNYLIKNGFLTENEQKTLNIEA